MRIATGLRIFSGSFFLILAAGILAVFLSVRDHRTYTKLAHLLNDMELAVSEITTSFSKQIHTGGTLAQEQMAEQFKIADSLLENLRAISPLSEASVVADLGSALQSSRAVVKNLTVARSERGKTPLSEIIHDSINEEYFTNHVLLSKRMRHAKSRWANMMRQSFERTIHLFTGFAFLFAITIIGASVYLGRAVITPIRIVEAGAKRLARGDISHRLPELKHRNELAQLAATFNSMAENLEKAIGDMKDQIAMREHAEAKLTEQAEDLKRSNADLEQFAYVASHDLQEPLRIIVSYLQLFERRYKDMLDEDGLSFMRATTGSATRMRELIRSLLAYSRIGRKGQEFILTDTGQVMNDVMGDLSLSLAETGATVEWEGLPIIHSDPIQIGQLFQNLIGNALKFRSATAPLVQFSAEQQGNEWIFCVRDNGIGIEPRHADRIFSIFQRLHGREQYPGTGIGLALCKRIVERHKGRIWVESEPGKGSAFYFTIPQ